MHYLKIILLVLVSGLAANVDAQSYRLEKNRYSVDTGICTIGSVVQFRVSLNLQPTPSIGDRYGAYIDFGDGTGEQKRDTIKSFPVAYKVHYMWHHVYQTGGMKTVRLYLTDSNDVRTDSIVNTYDVGSCKKAFGVLHAEGRPNCEFDPGEDVFESVLVKIQKNSKDMYIMTDSNSYYNLPVFLNDTFGYSLCPSKYITYNRPGGNFPVRNLHNEWAYFDTLFVLSEYVCMQNEAASFYFPRLTSRNSPRDGAYWITLDFGDKKYTGALYSFGFNSSWNVSHIYDTPGVYHAKFLLQDKYANPLIQYKAKVYVDSCQKIAFRFHYDADSNCTYDKGEATLDTTYIQLHSQKGRSFKRYTDTSGLLTHYYVYKGDTVTIDTLTWYKYSYGTKVNPFNKLVCGPVMTYGDSIYYASYKPRQVYGYLYKDINSNCVFDTAEPPVIHQAVLAICNDSIAAVTKTDSNGMYVLNIGKNQDYFIKVDDVNMYGDSISCSASTVAIAKYGPDTTTNFAYKCPSVKNAGIVMYNDPIAQGDTSSTYVRLKYSSCDTGSAYLKVTLDTNARYIGSSLTPVQSSTSVLWYYLEDLTKNVQFPLGITYTIDTSVKTQTICHRAEIHPLFNDIDTTDNIVSICDSMREKSALDKSLSVQADSLGDTCFIYTISATNDSVQQVYNVRIIDTLDSALDPNSVVVLDNSHPVLTNISGNIISFTFYNTRISAIKGDTNRRVYIRFKVNPTLPMTTTISNNAGVYFDGEKAGQTNTVLYSNQPAPVIIASNNISSSGIVYPNPVKDILYLSMPGSVHMQLYDVLGRWCETRQLNNGSIDMTSLPVGNYLLQVINKEGERSYYKVVKQ